MREAGARPRVALCLAGAWRNDSDISWSTIRQHIVEPTGASVFVAHTNDANLYHGKDHRREGGYTGKYPSDSISADAFRAKVGPALRGAAIWEHSDLLAVPCTKWAGNLAAKATGVPPHNLPPAMVMNWVWYLKRWACQALVAADPRGPYDIVITSRPDLIVARSWKFEFASNASTPRKAFSLTVGSDAPVYFGEGEIVMPDVLNSESCINDWLAVATFAASTTLHQLIQHAYSSLAFVNANRSACPGIDRQAWPWSVTCCERLLGTYLWRIGLARQAANLHVWLARKAPASIIEKARAGYVGQQSSPEIDETSDGEPRISGLCLLGEYAQFGQVKARSPLPGSWPGSFEQVRTRCPANTTAHTAMASANNETVCWHKRPLPGLGTKSWVSPCPSANIPVCKHTVNLLAPLKPCIRDSNRRKDVVTQVSGYGEAFPWWDWCDGPCEPLPNVTFGFTGNEMEAAVVFPYQGLAKRAHPVLHNHPRETG